MFHKRQNSLSTYFASEGEIDKLGQIIIIQQEIAIV